MRADLLASHTRYRKAFALSLWDLFAALSTFVLCTICDFVEAYTHHFTRVATLPWLQHCGFFQSLFKNGSILPKLIVSEAKFCF